MTETPNGNEAFDEIIANESFPLPTPDKGVGLMGAAALMKLMGPRIPKERE